MKRFKLFVIISLTYLSIQAQVTKLPAYAIQKIYQIDAVRDTIGFRNGGVLNGSAYEYIDSIVYRYNKKGQIDRETIWRFENFMPYGETDIENSNGLVLDTSRNFRQYYYDSKGREIAVHHGRVFGSPRRNNVNNYQSFPFGGPYYFEHLDRIDSTGYDSHDNLIFKRRYENLDFQNKNFTMVVKNDNVNQYKPSEIDYQYDNQGRVIKEKGYVWDKGVRYNAYAAPNYPIIFYDFDYKYLNDTKLLLSRSYPFAGLAGDTPVKKDSLFTYDELGRNTSSKIFGHYYDDNGQEVIRYDGEGSLIDTIVYLDNQGSFQRYYNQSCYGEKYYEDGKFYFDFKGNIGDVILCFDYKSGETSLPYTKVDSLRNKNNFTLSGRINHYQIDSEGNVLARDSSYLNKIYGEGDLSYYPSTSYHFDTIAYYGFMPIEDVINSINNTEFSNPNMDVYPNPSVGSEINVVSSQSGGILLCSSMGEIVGSYQVISNQVLNINISHLPKGMYIVQYHNERKKVMVN